MMLFSLLASCALAAPLVVPPGLSPGAQYRLVFVTTETMAATSSNIVDYDSFVTSQALLSPELAALGGTWQVIGSTETVDAFTHIGGFFNIPIYNLAGQLVANGSSGLWDASIDASIRYDQSGSIRDGLVWTGTNTDGSRSNGLTLGNGAVVTGTSFSNDAAWISNTPLEAYERHFLYGISPTLTVPELVPEPGTMGLWALGLAVLYCRQTRRRIP